MILSFVFLMNQTSMARITLVVLVSTQQAQPVGGRTPELSSELFDSLQRADDPLMQQLGSFLSASVAETADRRRCLAVSEEKARINQMVRDYEERGISTFHHDRWQMAHAFKQIILPHIVDRPTRVYFENLD